MIFSNVLAPVDAMEALIWGKKICSEAILWATLYRFHQEFCLFLVGASWVRQGEAWVDAHPLQRQQRHLGDDLQETHRGVSSPRRRIQLSESIRRLFPGQVPLQPRTQRVVLQTQDVLHGLWHQTLRRPSVVQRRGIPGQEPRHAPIRRHGLVDLIKSTVFSGLYTTTYQAVIRPFSKTSRSLLKHKPIVGPKTQCYGGYFGYQEKPQKHSRILKLQTISTI